MSVKPAAILIDSTTGRPELLHVVCFCDDAVTLCGQDATSMAWQESGDECVVCLDLERIPCERCDRGQA